MKLDTLKKFMTDFCDVQHYLQHSPYAHKAINEHAKMLTLNLLQTYFKTCSSTLFLCRRQCSALERRLSPTSASRQFLWNHLLHVTHKICSSVLILFVTQGCGNIAHWPMTHWVRCCKSNLCFTFLETKQNIPCFVLLHFQCFKFYIFNLLCGQHVSYVTRCFMWLVSRWEMANN